MAEPLFCLHPALAALLKAFPDSLSHLFPGLCSRHSSLPVTRSISHPSRHFSPRFSPLYFPVPRLFLPYPFPAPPRVLARSLFAPVPVCPPSHPRVRFSCRFYTEIKHPGLWIAFYYCVLFSYFCFFMKNKYICWVVKRKLIFRLLFLCLPGASRLFLSGIFRKG